MLHFMKPTLIALCAAALLAGCSTPRPSATVELPTPKGWYAPPLAHQGDNTQLAEWWKQFNDPILSDWIARAQAQSPSVADARAQVLAARAGLAGAQAAAGPQLGLTASATRGQSEADQGAATFLSAGLSASWELGLWGEQAGRTRQARAQEASARAGWHDARVVVAAQAAAAYFEHRLCLEQLGVATRDAQSRAITAENNRVSEQAGFTAPAVAALARASSADAAGRASQQTAICERQVKSAAALTAQDEPAVREQIASAPALQTVLGQGRLDTALSVKAVPADLLRQRPDVHRAQLEVLSTSEGVGVARAALLPSLSLSGSWLRNRLSSGGTQVNYNTWSVGPLLLNFPLLGRGALQANVGQAQGAFEASVSAYASALRQAVAEVEQSLVDLSSLQERAASNGIALAGYSQSFDATQARYTVGLASLNELEEARRLRLSAESGSVVLVQERLRAWLSLYLALGGGFDADNPSFSNNDLNNPPTTP